jgi:transposase InsO family protein
MNMDNIRVPVEPLLGKENWVIWKWKTISALDVYPGVLGACEKKPDEPVDPGANATEDEQKRYETAHEKYCKTVGRAQGILAQCLGRDAIEKVIRFKKPWEIWAELLKLYDGASEDKIFNLTSEFFDYNPPNGRDISGIIADLKTMWGKLNIEIVEHDQRYKDLGLPEVFLVSKILHCLPPPFFQFKSSWMLINKDIRTVDKLTIDAVAHERVLNTQGIGTGNNDAALFAGNNHSNGRGDRSRFNKQSKSQQPGHVSAYKGSTSKTPCHYCGKTGHWIKECRKWIGDGKPRRDKHDGAISKMAETSKDNAAQSGKSNNDYSNWYAMEVTTSAEVCSGECVQMDWYVDNGSTQHICINKAMLHDYVEFKNCPNVFSANKGSLTAEGFGKVRLICPVFGKEAKVVLTNVWYVPGMAKNLFSVLSAQDRLLNSEFMSKSVSCCLFDGEGKAMFLGYRVKGGNLYKIDAKVDMSTRTNPNVPSPTQSHNPSPSQCKPMTYSAAVSTGGDFMQKAHERLGHQNFRHVKEVVERELNVKVNIPKTICEGCAMNKAHKMPFGDRSAYRATKPGEIIHSDVCGPFPTESLSGNKYYVLLKDDYSRFRQVYFIKHKNEVAKCIDDFLDKFKVLGHVCRIFQCDGGLEYLNQEVKQSLSKRGIELRPSTPYNQEQNGCAERDHRTIVEMSKCLLHAHTGLPPFMWAEMMNTSAYILNRTGVSGVAGKSPHEVWYGTKPRISHFRVIGTVGFAHIPKQLRNKLESKAMKCILVGYNDDTNYRLYVPSQRKIIWSHDVRFQVEPLCKNSKEFVEQGEQIEQSIEQVSNPPSAIEFGSDSEEEIEVENEPDVPDANDVGVNQNAIITPPKVVRRSTRHAKKIDKQWPREQSHSVQVEDAYVFEIECNDPFSYEQAMESDEKKSWIVAMNSEISSLKENKTWKLVSLPPNRKAIKSRWVFKTKLNPDGTIDKYKARLVVKGFAQKAGVDYDQTFSPVAKSGTIRSVIAVAANEGMELLQFDVSTAFLYGELQEEIYMAQPEGYNDGTTKVCKLLRSLYGLKQAPRCWNRRIGEFLKSQGFNPSEADPCLFIKITATGKIILAIYVDDGLIAFKNKQEVNEFITMLQKEFKVVIKPASYYLGIQIEKQNGGSIKIHQSAYLEKVLKRFGMDECNPVTTPMVRDGEKQMTEVLEENFPYREAVGALMYLMVGTRPDIAYAVGVVSRTLENPTFRDWSNVKRIMRYLRGTSNLGLTYEPNKIQNELTVYSDADYGGCIKTGCSTTGVVCLYGGGAVTWFSQRQKSTSLSTTESEIIAASEAARELVWLKRLFESLVGQREMPPIIYVDNEAAIRLAQNPEYHKRTKHIPIRHFFVRQQVSEGEMIVKRVATKDNVADMFTKPMPRPRLLELNVLIGLK